VLLRFEHISLVCGPTRSRTFWAYTDYDRGGTSKTDKNDRNDAAAICEAVGSVYSGENGHPVPRKAASSSDSIRKGSSGSAAFNGLTPSKTAADPHATGSAELVSVPKRGVPPRKMPQSETP
jgi:hypothetical protein